VAPSENDVAFVPRGHPTEATTRRVLVRRVLLLHLEPHLLLLLAQANTRDVRGRTHVIGARPSLSDHMYALFVAVFTLRRC
jgi:hypothetical protein